jgi:primosomal protein N' (replication factor Y) (superfamily II helicase)
MPLPDDQKDLVTVVPATALDLALTYRLAGEFAGKAAVGCRVLIPLGSRVVTGFVIAGGGLYSGQIRDVIDLLDAEPLFDDGTFRFFRFLADYYGAPLGEVIRKALPTGFTIQTRRVVRAAGDYGGADDLDGRIIELARAPGGVTVGSLMKRLGRTGVSYRLDRLARAGAVVVEEAVNSRTERRRGVRVVKMRPWQAPEGFEKTLSRSPKLGLILAALRDEGEIAYSEIAGRWGPATDQVKRLAELGAVDIVTDYREAAIAAADMPTEEPEDLTGPQQEAVEEIGASIQSGGFAAYLLYGVTGSGKTEVYIRAAQKALEKGKGAIVLVPEIALTPQLTAQFASRLGQTVALFHSGLSDGQRLDQWWRVKTGQARVAVGARSALFAPLSDPGVIIVDEEHDPSYKQGETPRYHARDAAVMLARIKDAVVVLGSATPSLESVHNARIGRYRRLVLPDRVTAMRRLPEVEIVDMREAAFATRNITERLADEIRAAMEGGRQAILLLNRRGFSSFILCPNCGHNFPCPSCSITLTYHKGPGKLLCHYCDYTMPAPDVCPECAGYNLMLMGAGVERVQEELAAVAGGARILRLDRDAAQKRGQTEKILTEFSRHRADILIGTQMVAKGHDFPDVTLVGVINADVALNLPDFRAGERTFTLLAQAAGRAGRGDQPSKVIIQTYNPAHYAITAASMHDFDGFADRELAGREELSYPPFCRLALVRFAGPDPAAVRRESGQVRGRFDVVIAQKKLALTVLGPVPAPIERIRDRHRCQILVKAVRRRDIFDLLAASGLFGGPVRHGGVAISVDIDPTDML